MSQRQTIGVGDDDAGEDEDAEAGEQDDGGRRRGRLGWQLEGSAGEGFEDEVRARTVKARGRRAAAVRTPKSLKLAAMRPVEEWGFFEVADAVGVEGDPVVAEEHLAGDFGVDGVGVVEERRGEEGEAGVEDEPESEEDEAVAR